MQVTVIYESTRGRTKAMADAICEGVRSSSVDCNLIEAARFQDIGDACAFAIGSSTRMKRPLPKVRQILAEMGKIDGKPSAAFGSYGWSGEAPDFIVGYNEGYRHSWNCASGVVTGSVFEDNVKAWSGDHCVDPRLVPGVFFCSRPIDSRQPSLVDMAPTALRVFGLEPAPFMEGKPLFQENPLRSARAQERAG